MRNAFLGKGFSKSRRRGKEDTICGEPKEVELEEKIEEKDGNSLEEIEIEAEEGEILTSDTHRPPKDKADHSLLFISFDEPSIFFPTPPTPKTLNPNFCQSISEPLLKAPNFELRAFEELVRSKYKNPLCPPFRSVRGGQRKESLNSRETCFHG